MIRTIHSYDVCQDFVCSFHGDPAFSDSMPDAEDQLQTKLLKALEQPEKKRVLGVFQNDQLIGLFVFLILPDDHYMEMLVGLSRSSAAYGEMMQYLEQNYPSYQADFVWNPRNTLLTAQLKAKNADFDPEQQKMVLGTPVLSADTTGVAPYSPPYAQQYFSIHNKDMYWTGEKVVTAPDRFRTFLAIHNEKVVGYLDVTHCFDENEPYDLFVLKDYRRMGYGRKLLSMAVEQNQPNGMMLLVNVDNTPAIRLYESMGFTTAENGNSITAHWNIPSLS